MKINKSKVAEIHFTLKNESGEVLDSTQNATPHTYLHGANNLVIGMEEVLEDLEAGATFDATLPPEKTYGMRDERLIQEIPKEHFPQDIELKIGQQFVVEGPKGPAPIYVTEIRENTVLVDGNHPLASQSIHFSGNVVSVRDATEQELAQGGVGSSCCNDDNCSEHK